MCSYLYRRGAVYCTRLAVPQRLRPIIGKSDLGRSLRTKDRDEAKRLMPIWLAEAQAVIAAAEAELAQGGVRKATAVAYPFTQEQADWEAEQDRLRSEFDWEMDAQEEAADALEARLDRPEAELTTDEVAVARVVRRVRRRVDNYRDRYNALKHRVGQRDRVAGEGFAANPPGLPIAPGTLLDTNIVDLWAAERKPKEKGIETHRAVARWFYERVGRKPVNQITKADVLAFKSKLLEEGQSAANIKQKLSRLRTLLQWASDNGHAESNVAHGITIKDTQAARNKRK